MPSVLRFSVLLLSSSSRQSSSDVGASARCQGQALVGQQQCFDLSVSDLICAPHLSFAPPSLQKRKNNNIAVIGDGAITGGMAYEAMNHAGFLDTNMIVILNDNQQVRSMRRPDGLVRGLSHDFGDWRAHGD